MVYPFILRRTKQQVAPELPARTERIIYTDLEPAQRKLYNHTRDYYRGVLMGLLEEGGLEDVRMKILEGLLRLRQICIHPVLVEPTYRGEAAKFEILFETMETLQAEGHKALVFSQFVQTLHLIETEMQRRKFSYTYLDGQTRDRQERVDKFQNDASISFFLISLKAGGVGLNLTAADYVIHIDPWWNPAVEMQAADRAHRIGQDKPVFIYKFIARETVEEKILQLQERKKELVEQLITAEGSFFKSMTKEDVKVLFS
jgi:non-specific serine/threonine protein kinase